MKVAVIGLGLIGGSMAKSIRKFTNDEIFAYDASKEVLESALQDGTIDGVADDEVLKSCDIIFVALYPQDTVDFIVGKKEVFKDTAIIIDCCGVKQKIVDGVSDIADSVNWNFIGGHPMAGKEVNGYKNSDDTLWQDSYFILTPCNNTNPKILEKATQYIKNLGFKDITLSDPKHHDEVIAYTSHLPHILACAYVFNPISREHQGFSAGSYKDVSRVALINEVLWSELFLDNKDALCKQIDTLIKDLDELKSAIESQDVDALREKLKIGRLIKTEIH